MQLRVTLLLLAVCQLAAALRTIAVVQDAACEDEWKRPMDEPALRLLVKRKQADFEKTKAKFKQVCEAPKPERNTFRIALEPKFNLAYCIHNKAASSTLMRHLYKLHGNKTWYQIWRPASRPQELAPRKVNVTNATSLNAYRNRTGTFTFSFVRHPFHRLVSAFVNKVISGKDPHFKWLAEEVHYNFPEFVDYVLREFQDQGRQNDHWEPWYRHCHPCTIDYDFIGKVEHFSDDMRYIVEAAGLRSQNLEIDRVRRVSSQGCARSDNGNRTATYFAMVPPEKRRLLYEFYKEDFDLFDYSPDPFL